MWISKEKYEDIERRVKELNEELQRLYNLAYLVDIKQINQEGIHRDTLRFGASCANNFCVHDFRRTRPNIVSPSATHTTDRCPRQRCTFP